MSETPHSSRQRAEAWIENRPETEHWDVDILIRDLLAALVQAEQKYEPASIVQLRLEERCRNLDARAIDAEAKLAQAEQEKSDALEAAHYATGVSKLAMKHRDDAEARLASREATIADLRQVAQEMRKVAFAPWVARWADTLDALTGETPR